jgi:hypothetical protein
MMAGFGVAALAPRMLPFGVIDVGPKLGHPDLPRHRAGTQRACSAFGGLQEPARG